MKTGRNRVIVVTEDAYKQNTVYRPWSDIVSHKPNPMADATGQAARSSRLTRRVN